MTKKIVAFTLSLILLASCFTSNSFAIQNNASDSETIITIDGITYRIEESYINNNKSICITNQMTNKKEVVYYDNDKNTVYLDNKPIAFINTSISEQEDKYQQVANYSSVATGWKHHDTSWHTISWLETATIIVIASAIAVVIPTETTAGIIGKMGLTALKTIAGLCTNGRIRCVTYTQVLLDGSVQYRHDWTFFAPTGEGFGPYSTYYL